MTEGTPIPPPRNFPFEWEDPADAGRYWVTDLQHTAYPRAPLAGAVGEAFSRGMGKVFGSGGRPPNRRVINGYVYTEVRGGGGPSGPPPPLPGYDPRHGPLAHWLERVLPEVEAITGPLREFPVDDVSPRELAEHVLALEGKLERLGTLHHQAVMPAGGAKQAFITFCGKHDISPDDADAMLHGVEHLSLDSSREQWELGRLAAARPALHPLLDGPADGVAQRLREAGEAAGELLAGVEAHARRFGWRPAGLYPFALPVIDDRAPVWGAITAVVRDEMPDPGERHAAVARRRDALVAAMRGRLGDEARAEFDALYDRALAVYRILEDHNVCIDQQVEAFVRRACDRLARRLQEAGVFTGARDAWFLTPADLVVLDPGRPSAALQAQVTARRQDWERWCAYTPPVALGTRPPVVDEFSDQFLGRIHAATGNPRVLGGTAASAGVATGTARVLRDLREADRLQQGDILVCVTTLPPWTTLFARAAAVVTVSGGVLSHAAITAREFGVPAVLSVADATVLIRDGQRITVDGANGVVRLED